MYFEIENLFEWAFKKFLKGAECRAMKEQPVLLSAEPSLQSIFLFLPKFSRILATLGYKPAQMTALMIFSLSVVCLKRENIPSSSLFHI